MSRIGLKVPATSKGFKVEKVTSKRDKPNLPSESTNLILDGQVFQTDLKSLLALGLDAGLATIELATRAIKIKDTLRLSTGKYWFRQKDGNVSFYEKGFSANTFPEIQFNTKIDYVENSDPVSYPFGFYEQEVVFKTDNKEVLKIIDLLQTGKSNVYFDHAFEAPIPYSGKALEKYTAIKNPFFYDCNPTYNLYVKDYEEKIKDNAVPEQILPNLNVVYLQSIADKKLQQYEDLISLKGSVSSKLIDLKGSVEYWKRNSIIKNASTFKYFKSYGNSVLSFVKNDKNKANFETLRNKFKNVGVDPESVRLLNEASEFKDSFSMYTDIGFKTDVETDFADFMKKANLSDILLTQIMNLKTKAEFYFANNKEKILRRKNTSILDVSDLYQKMTEFLKQNKLSDLEKLDNSDESIILFLEDEMGPKKTAKFLKSLSLVLMGGKMKEFAKTKFRDFEDIMTGALCHSEVLLYRIEKTDETGKVIQNTFIPNSSELDIVKFIDSQVKYGKKYSYNVYAHYFVVGTKYYYDEVANKKGPKFKFAGGGKPKKHGKRQDKFIRKNKLIGAKGPYYKTFSVKYAPSFQIVEAPYFSKEVEILSNPPISPDVNFVPYINKEDRILINLNRGTDEILTEPIYVNKEDKKEFDRIAAAQNVETKITFKSDDNEPIKFFEVYRIDKKPSSYQSFAGKMIKRVETLCMANSAAYLDKQIKPNRKYYYTFRTVDIHNHTSNPSAVYEIELVDDSGYIYPEIRVIDFETREIKQIERSAKKYILIKATNSQIEIDPKQFIKKIPPDPPASPVDKLLPASVRKERKAKAAGVAPFQKFSAKDLTNVEIGIVPEGGESIWDKKFKLRLKSKKTGRIIDLNFSFKRNFIPFKEEQERKDLC